MASVAKEVAKKMSVAHAIPLLIVVLTPGIWTGCKTASETVGSGAGSESELRRRGEELVAEYLKRDAAPYRKSFMRFTIKLPNQPEEVYDLEVWRKQARDETNTLTQIRRGAEGAVASLTIERPGQETVNVSYVPVNNQFRETGTNKTFFGGLTTGELLGEWHKYDLKLKAEKEVKGVKVYEVESTLKPSADSQIARFITLFRADNYLPLESRLFNSRSEQIRVYDIKEIRTVEGHDVIWRTEVENYTNDGKIRIEMVSVSFPKTLDDAAFTRERLKEIAKN